MHDVIEGSMRNHGDGVVVMKEIGTFDCGRRVGRYSWYKDDGTIWQSLDL